MQNKISWHETYKKYEKHHKHSRQLSKQKELQMKDNIQHKSWQKCKSREVSIKITTNTTFLNKCVLHHNHLLLLSLYQFYCSPKYYCYVSMCSDSTKPTCFNFVNQNNFLRYISQRYICTKFVMYNRHDGGIYVLLFRWIVITIIFVLMVLICNKCLRHSLCCLCHVRKIITMTVFVSLYFLANFIIVFHNMILVRSSFVVSQWLLYRILCITKNSISYKSEFMFLVILYLAYDTSGASCKFTWCFESKSCKF